MGPVGGVGVRGASQWSIRLCRNPRLVLEWRTALRAGVSSGVCNRADRAAIEASVGMVGSGDPQWRGGYLISMGMDECNKFCG